MVPYPLLIPGQPQYGTMHSYLRHSQKGYKSTIGNPGKPTPLPYSHNVNHTTAWGQSQWQHQVHLPPKRVEEKRFNPALLMVQVHTRCRYTWENPAAPPFKSYLSSPPVRNCITGLRHFCIFFRLQIESNQGSIMASYHPLAGSPNSWRS